MARRNPRARGGRALGVGAVALAAALAGAIAHPVGHAEPVHDLARAKDLYQSAEAAMRDGRYDDAARDYGAAYELSADPALFYKIAHANERAGKCDIALVYYARYLREGKPSEQFVALTRERIAACGGDPDAAVAAGVPPRPGAGGEPGSAAEAAGSAAEAAGSAAAGSAAGSAAGTTTGSAGSAAPGPGPATAGSAAASPGSAAAPSAGAGSAEAAAGAGSAAPVPIPPAREKVAWLLSGSAIALVTLGGVLSYAASSSENDIRDLYAGLAGQAPVFDAQTRKRYGDLIDEGRRYQHLAWAAFGLAGAAAVGAAVLFAVGRDDEPTRHARVAPVVGPRGAGVSVRF